MTRSRSNVVRIKDYRPKPEKQKSVYDLYPLPFLNRKALRTWDVTPIGDYEADCITGKAYAIEFLKSCNGTIGWAALFSWIVGDMICAGTSGTFADGHPRINGVVVGFTSEIGKMIACRC